MSTSASRRLPESRFLPKHSVMEGGFQSQQRQISEDVCGERASRPRQLIQIKSRKEFTKDRHAESFNSSSSASALIHRRGPTEARDQEKVFRPAWHPHFRQLALRGRRQCFSP